MASYTPNLGLIKPAGSDNVAVQQLNTNMDVLDREVHENTEKIDRIRVAAPPYIDSTTKHWMVFDPETGAYEDSGVVAEAKGPYINETNGDWMIWDDVNLTFVDSGIVAVGHPASMTANATTLPAGSSATASVTGTPENPVLNIGVPRGNTGDAAGFATPSATVDANVGTPSVTVTASGPDTAKQFAFEFHNLKGRDGTIGYTPDIHIGTVESVPEGAQAEVTRTGTDEDPYLNFKLPRSGAGIGFYPIDFTIAVAGWTYDSTEQRYKHEHSDNTINTRMRIVEWYIQNWDLMLGATDLIIASGKVTVWTDTIPTAAWNMHVDFATDGSEVLDELGDIDDRVDTLEGTVSDQSDQIGNLGNGLAYGETGTTSSRAYSIGDIIFWNGKFYTVISAIANSGVAFTIGGNVQLADTAGILNGLRQIVVNSTISVTVPANGSISDRRIYFTCPDGYQVTSVVLIIQSYEVLIATVGGTHVESGVDRSYILAGVKSFFSLEDLTRSLTAKITLSKK